MKKRFLSGMSEIPAAKSGGVSVEHKLLKKGSREEIVNMRTALFTGKRAQYTVLERDYWKHVLREEGVGVWMTDSLQEIKQMRDLVADFHGSVLVGGLGLGVVLQVLPPEVYSVIVVERSLDIIDLVWDYVHTPERDEVVIGDLYDLLPKHGGFDFCFFDIWQPTGERTLYQHVLPLRRLLQDYVPQENIRCWGEQEMWGQIQHALEVSILVQTTDTMPAIELQQQEYKEELFRDPIKGNFERYLIERQPSQAQAQAQLEKFMQHPLEWRAP